MQQKKLSSTAQSIPVLGEFSYSHPKIWDLEYVPQAFFDQKLTLVDLKAQSVKYDTILRVMNNPGVRT